MQTVQIVAVGSLKEKFWKDACNEFIKRLSRFCRIAITELAENPSKHPATALEEEGKRITEKLKGYVIVLAVQGKKLSSEALSEKLSQLALMGSSDITFVIGSSHGLSNAVLQKADMLLSFSDMTFPHQLMRVILLEQIYRAYGIAANTPYHK